MNKVVIAVKVVVTGVGTEVARGLLFTEEETARAAERSNFSNCAHGGMESNEKGERANNGTAAVSMISRAAVCG